MKKIIITETQLKNLIKRRSLNESPILYPLPTDKNPEADEIDFEDLQAAGDMYDRLKSGEDSDNKLNVDVVGGKFVDTEGDMEEYGTEETFENTDFGLNLNEGQIQLKKTFNKFMKNPIIKNLGDTL
jgi:hypothetical protein